jgi:hypothetical protein
VNLVDLADGRVSVEELLEFAKEFATENTKNMRCAMIVLLDKDLVPTCFHSHEGPEMIALMALYAQRVATMNADGLIIPDDGDDNGSS